MKKLSIILMPTYYCNAKCDYCFISYKNQKYTIEIVNKIFNSINDFLEIEEITNIDFYWQGGEVMTMGTDFFLKIKEISDNIFNKKKTSVNHFLQTNLILLSEKWIEIIRILFLNKLSTSIDFPNNFRKLKNGDTHFYRDIWEQKFNYARENNINVSVISLVHPDTVISDPYEFFSYYSKHLKLNTLQLNLPLQCLDKKTNEKFENYELKKLSKFLIKIYDISKNNNFVINPFHAIESRLLNNSNTVLPCIFTSNCSNSILCIDPIGNVTNCDFFTGFKSKLIFGNILRDKFYDIFHSPLHKIFSLRLNYIMKDDCGSCKFLSICYGGCPIRGITTNSQDLLYRDRYCPVYKNLFEHILSLH